MSIKKNQGFTLIELMIVVAIVAIIAAIAYPSYQQYVKRTKRIEVQSYLMELSHKLESYKLVNRNYKGATISVIGGGAVFPNANTQTYEIKLTDSSSKVLGSGAEDGKTWHLVATPAGGQIGDGAIRLTNTNQKCWYKNKDDASGACLSWSDR